MATETVPGGTVTELRTKAPAGMCIAPSDTAEPDAPACSPIAVQGWACDSDDAPVIVNPTASKQALLAWGFAQLQQVNVMLYLIGCASHDLIHDPAEVCGAVRHFTVQAETALGEALQRN